MTILKISGDGIEDNAITNAHLHSSAEIAGSKIADGAITNAKINASAAIAGTKISPDFGSQAITTLGGITGGGLTSTSNININNDSPSVTFNDTNSENDFRLTNSHGTFVLFDNDAGATRMSCTSAGQFTFATNVDFSSGIDVTGNITTTGTVDGVDIATRDTLFGGLTSSSGALTNGVTATTQSAGDNSTKVATTAYTDTAISNLVDSSPSALNTLNELAAALGDDANFSTTVTNSIATKLPLAGGTLTGALIGTTAAFSSTSSSPAFEAKGDGSSQDGYIQLNCSQNSHGIKLKSPAHSAGASYTLTFPSSITNGAFLTTDANGNLSWGTPTDTNTQLSNSQVRAAVEAASDSNVFTDADHTKLNGIESNATADQSKSDIDALGIAASTAATLATARTIGGVSFNGSANINLPGVNTSGNQNTSGNAATATTSTRVTLTNQAGDSSCNVLFSQSATGDQLPHTNANLTFNATNGTLTATSFSGSGANLTNLPSQTDQNFTTALKNKLDGIAASATNVTNNNQLTNGAGYITSAALAGASDGGNAALLDGIDSTQFLRADQDDSTTGILSLETNSQYPLTIDGNDNGKIVLQGSANPYIRFREGTTDKAYFQWNSGGYIELFNQETSESLRIKSGANGLVFYEGGNERTVWHSGNDGASSNLDADKLDGQQGSYYLDYGNLTNVPTISSFPSGTRMIFQQTSAPTGWTKDTSDTNQRALRVVSGTASSGGSVDFTTAFASKGVSGSIANGGNNTNNGGNNTNNATAGGSVNNHTLNTNRMPQHRHDGGAKGIHDAANGQYGTNQRGNSRYPLVRFDALNGYANYDTYWTSYTGSSHSHNHGFSGSAHSHSINAHSHTINAHNHSFSGTAINLAVRYLDVIIAQKD